MPRPPVKRRKPNGGQEFTLRSPRRTSRIPDQSRAREEHEKNLAAKPIGKRLQDSDDSDELVTTRSNSFRPRKKQEIYASGAVGKGDEPGVFPTKPQRTRSMREDTEEILSQRSKSASRANSEASDKDKTAKKISSQQSKSVKSPIAKSNERPLPKKSTIDGINNYSAETSVLGKIKPRKRQASILQLIDNNEDTTSFLSDELSGFLPDELSTPHTETAKSPTTTNGESLKRKRPVEDDADEVRLEFPKISAISSRVEAVLSSPSRAQRKTLAVQKPAVDEDDYMAPPQSSDEEEDVPVVSVKATARSKPVALSTQQLQSLLPSKRHQEQKPKKTKNNEFDIPLDSDEQSEDEREVSNFIPGKSQKSQKTVRKTKSKPEKTTGLSRSKKPPKSTRNTSTPSPVQLRTPRPLSVSKSKESLAKSTSKQGQSVMQDKSSNTPLQTRQSAKKQYGGFRNRGTIAGKENDPVLLSSEALDGDAVRKKTNAKAIGGAARAWSKKWADIDNFSLEFDEVSPVSQDSSPPREILMS